MTIATGTQVVLRHLYPEEIEPLREWLHPDQEWHRWDGPYFPPASDEDRESFIQSMLHEEVGSAVAADGLPFRRVVIADAETDELLGTVSWHWESQSTEWARMGITVYDPRRRGSGIGQEALSLWTSYLFGHRGWRRLDYSTWSGNLAMLGVGRRLGFTEEARFRRARVVRGEIYDSVVMGVLRDEWLASPRPEW